MNTLVIERMYKRYKLKKFQLTTRKRKMLLFEKRYMTHSDILKHGRVQTSVISDVHQIYHSKGEYHE